MKFLSHCFHYNYSSRIRTYPDVNYLSHIRDQNKSDDLLKKAVSDISTNYDVEKHLAKYIQP